MERSQRIKLGRLQTKRFALRQKLGRANITDAKKAKYEADIERLSEEIRDVEAEMRGRYPGQAGKPKRKK